MEGRDDPLGKASRQDLTAIRPIIQTLARVIAADRRAALLGGGGGEILLANAPAQRLGLDKVPLTERFDWAKLMRDARRAGSTTAAAQIDGQQFEGELVHLPLGSAHGYLLRLSAGDQEAVWLRQRARAAALMRAAHDLRTPIQSLLASAEALMGDDQRAPLRRAAGLALDHVNNVLAVLRGEETTLPDDDFRIVEEVQRIVALIDPIAAARATRITLTSDAPEGLTLRGPVGHLRALCQNMIDNSVSHGGGRVDLHVACQPLDPDRTEPDADGEQYAVTLELRDEGGGLPDAQRARLTAALQGAPSPSATGKRVSAGTEVMAHALRQLGGEMAITDRGADGEAMQAGARGRVMGTIMTVRFSLPRAPDFVPAAPPEPRATTPLAGRRILLVEDSPASREWLRHVLISLGAEVTAASSALEALALLARPEVVTQIEMVLTDVTLPHMNGIQFAERLKAGDPSAAIRWQGTVVGLTAHIDPRIHAACLAAGMVCVLEKPIRPADLGHALSEAFGGNRPPLLNAQIAQDLAEQLGREVAEGFMRRALAEAATVLQSLREEGIGADTGRQLHAATGAAGLTGLSLVEGTLRQIELAVAGGAAPARLLDALGQAIEDSGRSIPAPDR